MNGDALVVRLGKLDTCAISDAMDRLGLDGVASGIRPLTSTARIAGRVVTVKLRRPVGEEHSLRHLGTGAIMAASPGDVIVIDHQGRDDVAGWGGILSTAADVRDVAGVIVDGACRDVDEARDLGFPVFARSATPRTARGRAIEESFNEPVTVAGIAVSPGDLVIADGTGVVFIPAARAEEVIVAAEQIAEREEEMRRAVLLGQPVTEVMGQSYERMTDPTPSPSPS
jgi:4-hydroxy-4-methyl-2-oxoglutarate aldolase